MVGSFEIVANRIVAKVPTSYERDSHTGVAIAFLHRGIALWRAHRQAVKGQSIAAPRILLRVLAELPITLGWMWLRPDIHIELWRAEYARNLATIYRGMPGTFAGQRLQATDFAAQVQEVADGRIQHARELIDQAARDGAPVKGLKPPALIPGTQEMVQQLVKAGKPAYNDTYQLAMRAGGAWVHSDWGSFLNIVEDGDGLVHNNERPPADFSGERMEAVGTLVSLIWNASAIASLGLDGDCQSFFERYAEETLRLADEFRDTTLARFEIL